MDLNLLEMRRRSIAGGDSKSNSTTRRRRTVLVVAGVLFPLTTQAFCHCPPVRRRVGVTSVIDSTRSLPSVQLPIAKFPTATSTALYLGLADLLHPGGAGSSITDVLHSFLHSTTFPTTLHSQAAEVLQSSLALSDSRMSESAFLSSLGHDVLVFLATTVIVVPISRVLGVTPVLGFLAAGFLLGPHGVHLFGNTEADVELGDFGILFLLFAEGLNLSPDRVKQLGAFGKLGVVQLLASMGLLFVGLVAAGPYMIQYAAPVLQMDSFVNSVFESPEQAFCIAAAGALSSSAFVLPVLKEKQWEDRPEGIAALAVLLLQDLAVAPLLVILPLVAGAGPQSFQEFAILIAKATVGFGAVLYIGSGLLKRIFEIVAEARSTETFVAAALLVAVGMGQAADVLGLSATTGAFAAGVLLANNKYRAQIKADIQPFEGLLLGLFFVTAGASLDPNVIMADVPTLMLGVAVFIVVKAIVLSLAAPAMLKTRAQSIRVAITLAGGGEFSLVLLNLARDLGLLPNELSKLLVASVIISMSLTPVLAEVAAVIADIFERFEDNVLDEGRSNRRMHQDVAEELFDKIDADNSGTIECEELRSALLERGLSPFSVAEIFQSFDTNLNGSISRDEWDLGLARGYLAQAISHDPGSLVETKELNVEVASDAIVICGYTEFGREMYQILEAAGCARNGGLVAFDLNPSRVAAGLLAGANIVYGNAASPELLRAAGVVNPKGVVLAFRSEAQRLDAAARLRRGLKEGTPIFARIVSGQSLARDDLIKAGVTEIVSERTESALRFAVLLGVFQDVPGWSKYRRILNQGLAASSTKSTTKTLLKHKAEEKLTVAPYPLPGIPEDRLDSICEEFGCSRSEILRLHDIFTSLPDATGYQFLPVKELEEVFLRRSEKPIDDETAQRWIEAADLDGAGVMSFIDFARAFYKVGNRLGGGNNLQEKSDLNPTNNR